MSMPQRDYGLMEPGRSPWWCIRRARINARFRMAANTRLKSKPKIMQTKPTQPFPLSITIPINSPCVVTLVRAPPGSSEAAEGKILVPTLLLAATRAQLFVSRVKLKTSTLVVRQEGGHISQSKLAGAIWSLQIRAPGVGVWVCDDWRMWMALFMHAV